MFYCPICGDKASNACGELCASCGAYESEKQQEYLYTTAEGRNELLGLNDLSPDFYGDDYIPDHV